MSNFTTTEMTKLPYLKAVETRKANLKKARRDNLIRKTYCTVIVLLCTANAIMGYFNAVKGLEADLSVPMAYASVVAPQQATDSVKTPDEVREYVFNRLQSELGLSMALKGMDVLACENKALNPDAYYVNKDKSIDRGIWMISSKYHKEVSSECAFNVGCSTTEAIRIIKERGYKEWTCGR